MAVQKRIRTLENKVTQPKKLSAVSVPLSLSTLELCYFPTYSLSSTELRYATRKEASGEALGEEAIGKG